MQDTQRYPSFRSAFYPSSGASTKWLFRSAFALFLVMMLQPAKGQILNLDASQKGKNSSAAYKVEEGLTRFTYLVRNRLKTSVKIRLGSVGDGPVKPANRFPLLLLPGQSKTLSFNLSGSGEMDGSQAINLDVYTSPAGGAVPELIHSVKLSFSGSGQSAVVADNNQSGNDQSSNSGDDNGNTGDKSSDPPVADNKGGNDGNNSGDKTDGGSDKTDNNSGRLTGDNSDSGTRLTGNDDPNKNGGDTRLTNNTGDSDNNTEPDIRVPGTVYFSGGNGGVQYGNFNFEQLDARGASIRLVAEGDNPVQLRVSRQGDARNAFTLRNALGLTISNGSIIRVGKNPVNLMIRYNPPRGNMARRDSGSFFFQNTAKPENKLQYAMKGAVGPVGPGEEESSILSLFDPNAVAGANDPTGSPAPDKETSEPEKREPVDMSNVPGMNKISRADFLNEMIRNGVLSQDSIVDTVVDSLYLDRLRTDSLKMDSLDRVALMRIRSFYGVYRTQNFFPDSLVIFEEDEEGRYISRLKPDYRSMMGDREFLLKPVDPHFFIGGTRVSLEIEDQAYDSIGTLTLIIPQSDQYEIPDSVFNLRLTLVPEFLGEGGKLFSFPDEPYVFNTSLRTQVKKKLVLWPYILGGLGFFFIVMLIMGRRILTRPIPVKALKYRIPPKDDKEREAKPLELDMNRLLTDLIELDFEGEPPFAEVATPPVASTRKLFKNLFLLFRSKDKFAYNAPFYSFRVEPNERLPLELKFKDREGLFLVETTMTEDIVSTDHQDFTLTAQRFNYKIFLDPREILFYSGPERTLKLRFWVIEEPFEGYSIYNRYVVPVKFTPKREKRTR